MFAPNWMNIRLVAPLRRFLVVFAILLVSGVPLRATEPEESLYRWRPVRLGAGGFVTGFVTHPLDAAIRYCRTDVGNAYRWDGTEWQPLLVRRGDQGMPAELASTPIGCGVDSIAVDPTNKEVVYLTMTAGVPDMLKTDQRRLGGNVYKSTNQGVNFTAGNLSVVMEPNGQWRTEGERLKVDPNNGNVLFYGSLKQGLWRSQDGGQSWQPVRGKGAPADNAHVLGIHFLSSSGVVQRENQPATKTVFIIQPDVSVLASHDGGVTWDQITASTELAGRCRYSTIDTAGNLYVLGKGSRDAWSWHAGTWQKFRVQLDWDRTPHSIASDPQNVKHLVAISDGGGLSRSLDSGKTWMMLGPNMDFSNTLGWLPQKSGWRSNAGVTIDRDGVCWVAQGNEGMIKYLPADMNAPPAKGTIDSVGIEEFVTHDVIMPPKGRAIFAVEDATGLVSADVDRFVAKQIPVQDQLLSNGTGLAWCPNAPEYLACVTADIHHTGSGKTYAAFSKDGGETWSPFGSYPVEGAAGKPPPIAGSIAISARPTSIRNGWKTGQDHLVWLPTGDGPTFYSHDGGQTWKRSEGFPAKNGYWIFALKQRLLAADPHIPDKFYLIGTWGGGFYVSANGGISWGKQERAGLPSFNHHAQLATNREIRDDLWFCDGWDGASQHGLWHSKNGGESFQKLDGIEFAITLCLGAGPQAPKSAKYATYFYGKVTSSPDWGVFRSLDEGRTWQRISYYPTGIFDQPTCMAASWDHFGQVIVGFNGNSFVVGSAE